MSTMMCLRMIGTEILLTGMVGAERVPRSVMMSFFYPIKLLFRKRVAEEKRKQKNQRKKERKERK